MGRKAANEKQIMNPECDIDFPVKEFHYQSRKGRPWVKFVVRGKPLPIWFYWCFPYHQKCYELAEDLKSTNPWVHRCYKDDKWERFEGSDPELDSIPLTDYVRQRFPYTRHIYDTLAYNWENEQKEKRETT